MDVASLWPSSIRSQDGRPGRCTVRAVRLWRACRSDHEGGPSVPDARVEEATPRTSSTIHPHTEVGERTFGGGEGTVRSRRGRDGGLRSSSVLRGLPRGRTSRSHQERRPQGRHQKRPKTASRVGSTGQSGVQGTVHGTAVGRSGLFDAHPFPLLALCRPDTPRRTGLPRDVGAHAPGAMSIPAPAAPMPDP